MLIPDRKTCEVNGIKMSYLSAGAGEPFLMIHGLLSNALDFCFQFEEFANRFSCLAPDVRGAGLTETPDPESATLDQAVDDMLEFITAAIPLDRRIVLLGHSYGGIISLEIVKRIPERVRCLVIVSSPAAISNKISSRVGVSLFKTFLPVIKPVLANRPVVDFYSHFINMSSANLTPDLKQVLHERNGLFTEKDLISMKGYFESVMEWAPSPVPEGFDIPSALFYGDRDLMFSRRDVAQLRGLFPNINVFKISGTGHSCMQEKPDVFNSYMNEFLAQCDL